MDYQYKQYQQRKKKKRIKLWVFCVLFLGIAGLFCFKTGFSVSQVVDWNEATQIVSFAKKSPKLPEDDKNRINVLLLGMRGVDESGEGALLSDSMIMLSFDKNSNKIALISIPRDLYVEIWGLWEKRKINFAYPHGGFDCVKKTVALATDQHIDYAISVNFGAVTELVDILGGVTIDRSQPFEESFQWAKEGWEEDDHWFIKDFKGEERWVFYVPEGRSVLDGSTTLYYVRSRYSTSDFDRMRRQQQVLMALKDKALSLGVLTNPVKIYNIIDLLGKNMRTDMSLGDMKDMIQIVSDVDMKNLNIKTKVFEATDEGLLYDSFINNEYVLLPIGDSLENIQKACRDIFN